MTLNPSILGDNPQQPSVTAQVYVPDQLIADAGNIITQPIIINQGTLKRGTVLGQLSAQPIEAKAGADNTGNGTIATLSTVADAKLGTYALVANSATKFKVTDPEGSVLAVATVGSAYSGGGINFTISAGGAAFVQGDSFSVTVIDATGQFITCVKTASDGSQSPVAILADDADASDGPVSAGAYVAGEFNGYALAFDDSWTLATLTDAMRVNSIYLKSSVSAAPPVSNGAP